MNFSYRIGSVVKCVIRNSRVVVSRANYILICNIWIVYLRYVIYILTKIDLPRMLLPLHIIVAVHFIYRHFKLDMCPGISLVLKRPRDIYPHVPLPWSASGTASHLIQYGLLVHTHTYRNGSSSWCEGWSHPSPPPKSPCFYVACHLNVRAVTYQA